jgi:hypothetical protein
LSRKHRGLDYQEACRTALALEVSNPELTVTRVYQDPDAGWNVEVTNWLTGLSATLGAKCDWDQRLRRVLAERSPVEARVVILPARLAA